MATPAANAAPAASPSATDPAPQSSSPPDAAAPSPAAPAAQNPSSAPADPLAALGSMWSGWMSKPSAAAAAPGSDGGAARAAPGGASGEQALAGAAAAATEWMAAAGSMWEGAVADVGSKLKAVDTAALGEQVAVIRHKSGRILEDVSRSVQSMNLSLDQEELQKRAETITTSTKQLLEKAGHSLQQGRQEALEIFVDAEGREEGGGGLPPWDERALPEGERKYADALRKEMLKIVVDAIYSKKRRTELFLGGAADREAFEFDFDGKAGMAMAALEADSNMRRLRAGLVPGKMKEDEFWNTYFFHVQRVRQSLLANDGVMPEEERVDDEDADALFADDGEDEELAALARPAANGADEGAKEAENGKRNWDDEIDAIFDDDE